VDKGDCTAKFWLADASAARAIGFDAKEIRILSAKVLEEQERMLEAWNGYFGN